VVRGDFIGIGLTSLRFLPVGDEGGAACGGEPMMETTLPGEAEWLVTSDTAVIWLDDQAGILELTPSAGLWMNTFFDGVGECLPPCLIEWVQGCVPSRVPYERKVGEERGKRENCGMSRGEEGDALAVAPGRAPERDGGEEGESVVWISVRAQAPGL
jgi:hypothetical protein